MAERFFVPRIPARQDTIHLTGDEAHHLAHVRRIGRGDHIRLFDGSGVECEAIVGEVGRRAVTVTIVSRETVNRELPFSLTLVCSPPKGERLRWLVEKATELGVTRFVPLLTERATEQARSLKPERTLRWVIEASKQCGRNVLMEVTDAVPWKELLEQVPSSTKRFVALSTGQPVTRALMEDSPDAIVLAVGPEGGFTDTEQEAARARGWVAISLGPRTLRVETAALAMVASVTTLTRPASEIAFGPKQSVAATHSAF